MTYKAYIQLDKKKPSAYTLYMGGARVSQVMSECRLTKADVIDLFTRWDTMNNEPKPTFDPEV